MVLTPVGYKCPDCARPVRSQYTFIKPRQLALASAAGFGVGVLGGIAMAWIAWGGLFLGLIWGSLTSEAVRRASGGHRGGTVGAVAAVSIGIGWFVGNLFGYVGLLTAGVAVLAALVQLAVIEFRR
jgi:hypothetical protein